MSFDSEIRVWHISCPPLFTHGHMSYICHKSNHEPLVLQSFSDTKDNKVEIYESPVFMFLSTRNQPGHITLSKRLIIFSSLSLSMYIYLRISKLCIYWLNSCPKYCIPFYALSQSTDKMNPYWCDIATIGDMGISDPLPCHLVILQVTQVALRFSQHAISTFVIWCGMI